MDPNSQRALAAVLKHEGGYSDHPSDPGGATNMGITHKVLAAWRKVTPYWKLPKSEIKALSKTEASAIYKANYWDKVRGDDLPDGVDLAVFDYAVNSGPGRAAKTLQHLVGAPEDGEIGPVTLAAVGNVHPDNLRSLINAYCDARMAFLTALPTFGTFGKGWTARVKAVRAEALSMAGNPAPSPMAPPSAPTPVTPRPAPAMGRGITGWLILAAVVAAVAVYFIFIKR